MPRSGDLIVYSFCSFREIFEEDGDGSVTREQAEHLRSALSTEQLQAIIALTDKAAFIGALVAEVKKEDDAKKKKEEELKPWSQDEQNLLQKALRTVYVAPTRVFVHARHTTLPV